MSEDIYSKGLRRLLEFRNEFFSLEDDPKPARKETAEEKAKREKEERYEQWKSDRKTSMLTGDMRGIFETPSPEEREFAERFQREEREEAARKAKQRSEYNRSILGSIDNAFSGSGKSSKSRKRIPPSGGGSRYDW